MNSGSISWANGYLFFDDGKIFSKKVNRFLRPSLANNGYNRITLIIDNKPKKLSIHRLIAECFIGKIPNGLVINHKNGIKTDNRIENLEYVTISYNVLHAYKTGLRIINNEHKERCKKLGLSLRMFTPEKEIEIYNKHKEGKSIKHISIEHSCHSDTIRKLIRRIKNERIIISSTNS